MDIIIWLIGMIVVMVPKELVTGLIGILRHFLPLVAGRRAVTPAEVTAIAGGCGCSQCWSHAAETLTTREWPQWTTTPRMVPEMKASKPGKKRIRTGANRNGTWYNSKVRW